MFNLLRFWEGLHEFHEVEKEKSLRILWAICTQQSMYFSLLEMNRLADYILEKITYNIASVMLSLHLPLTAQNVGITLATWNIQ